MQNEAWLLLVLPLLGFAVTGALGRRMPRAFTSWIGCGVVGAAFVVAVVVFFQIRSEVAAPFHDLTYYRWADAGTFHLTFGFLIDPLTSVMLLIVTGVGFLIHVYSVGYMAGDPNYSRYSSYLNLFIFSMLLLVLADNYLILTLGWGLVGLSAYLLFVHFGTLSYDGVFGKAQFMRPDTGILNTICFMLLIGAVAKSAQIPLYTWLPDAMEGPTPVSALIHAATMVTAGVYLIARMHPLFERAPGAQDTGAIIGALTLLIAATVALAQTDVKRVIAYSTMSQIGYMIMGVSIGAYAAGLFHLMTHAFFKALLFMAAGSLIGAMAGEQSLQRMGGFRRALPFTCACFLIGGLALSGIPPFSGFFSKDEVLLVTGERGGWHWALYMVGYISALLTAIYTFRLIFRAFWGEPVPEARELEHGHLHHADAPHNPASGEVEDTDVGFPGPVHAIAERAVPMRLAMGILAVGSVLAGLVQIPKVDFVVDDFLKPSFRDSSLYATHARNGLLIVGLVLGAVMGLAGIAIAYRLWVREPTLVARIRARTRPLYELFVNAWYFDRVIDALVVAPARGAGRFASGTFERLVVEEGLIGGTTAVVRAGSAAVRAARSGFVRYYAALLVLGITGVSLYFLLQS